MKYVRTHSFWMKFGNSGNSVLNETCCLTLGTNHKEKYVLDAVNYEILKKVTISKVNSIILHLLL